MALTPEQEKVVHELQAELRVLDLQADIEWAKYLHTRDEACFNEVLALESERELKGLIAYIPKAGERRISKIRNLVAQIKGQTEEVCDGCDLGVDEVRLTSLAAVNEWRDTYSLPPLDRLPQGVPGEASECTLAVAFRLSMEELGLEVVNVNVEDASTIELEGLYLDGRTWEDEPTLPIAASTLISDFDNHAWLDLLTDNTLDYYADSVAEEENLDRLQDISDEFARRERMYPVSYYPDIVLALGVGALPLQDQIASTNAQE